LDDARVPHGASVRIADSGVVIGSWISKPGVPAVTRTATGRYTINLPVGYLPSYTHVTAAGAGYCTLSGRNDYSFIDKPVFFVACYSAAGTLANTGFQFTYMTASPSE
jgi:hypothetical protein